MKTFKNLYPKITAFDNLLLAAEKARRGKRFQTNVAHFDFHLERNLFQLQQELSEKSYQPGKYRSFVITDPKERLISAAPYRDRVVHHAIMNVTAPIFERTFIFDSYANREGKGTHAAIRRYQHYARRFPYVLKCDIRKFFPSIDHEILKREIRWKIRCGDALWLIDSIIDNSNQQEAHHPYFPGDDLFTPWQRRHGLPIGNLTSQWWGNVYLNRFDHFIKEELRVPGYIRYVDDFVLFANDKQQLWQWKNAIAEELAKLRLLLHPDKTQIYHTDKGVPFLGFKVFPRYRIVSKQNTRRYRRFLRKKLAMRTAGQLSPAQLETALNSWLGHIRFGQSQRLEYQIFWYLRNYGVHPVESSGAEMPSSLFHGVNLFKHPSGSWRLPAEVPTRRQGSWNNNATNCRCSYRNRNHPINQNNNIGFRVARPLPAFCQSCAAIVCRHERAQASARFILPVRANTSTFGSGWYLRGRSFSFFIIFSDISQVAALNI